MVQPHDQRHSRELSETRIETRVDDGVLLLVLHGGVRRAGILGQLLDVVAEWADQAGSGEAVSVVVDVRDASFDVSGNEIHVAAQRLHALRMAGRIAIVVRNDFQFGLTRMLGFLGDGSGVTTYPFREMAEAEVWARSSQPKADPKD